MMFRLALRAPTSMHRFDLIEEWLGAGIFTLRHGGDDIERPQWYLHRKTASHIFKRRIFVNLMHKTFLST